MVLHASMSELDILQAFGDAERVGGFAISNLTVVVSHMKASFFVMLNTLLCILVIRRLFFSDARRAHTLPCTCKMVVDSDKGRLITYYVVRFVAHTHTNQNMHLMYPDLISVAFDVLLMHARQAYGIDTSHVESRMFLASFWTLSAIETCSSLTVDATAIIDAVRDAIYGSIDGTADVDRGVSMQTADDAFESWVNFISDEKSLKTLAQEDVDVVKDVDYVEDAEYAEDAEDSEDAKVSDYATGIHVPATSSEPIIHPASLDANIPSVSSNTSAPTNRCHSALTHLYTSTLRPFYVCKQAQLFVCPHAVTGTTCLECDGSECTGATSTSGTCDVMTSSTTDGYKPCSSSACSSDVCGGVEECAVCRIP